jgi:hypothetical protein
MLIFRQLFDPTSSTYSFLPRDPHSGATTRRRAQALPAAAGAG